jgi:hypothetical protein
LDIGSRSIDGQSNEIDNIDARRPLIGVKPQKFRNRLQTHVVAELLAILLRTI